MVIKIPELKSRYIPVQSTDHIIKSDVHWWKHTSPFVYPNVLINLLTVNKQQISDIRSNMDGELFLLTDSGGFQVISGKCNIDWKKSLQLQIDLNASKIFAFDKPPVKPKYKGSLSQFIYMTDEETKRIIEENLDVAIEQSLWLKDNYPLYREKFCYILHAKNYEHLLFNLELINKKIGDKYNEYFPGGVTYAIKASDNLLITIAARHAYETFVKKGIYVHFLGMGSFNKILILIRNEITTFDSSGMLQAVRINEILTPENYKTKMSVNTEDFMYDGQFCICPVCIDKDYNKLCKENATMVGRNLISHNLWHLLKQCVLLNSFRKDKYNELSNKLFKLNIDMQRCLNFCDDCDKNGFDITYNKYKHYLKKDETKQNTLF